MTPSAEIRCVPPHPAFLMGAGGLNSSPYVCMANTLLIEPVGFFFNVLNKKSEGHLFITREIKIKDTMGCYFKLT